MNNIWVTWGEVFNASLQGVWWGFVQWAPKLIVAIILFTIGWVLGTLVSKAFVQVFSSLKVDKLFQSIGADNIFRKAGVNLNTGYFVGELLKWFVIIVFLLPSLSLVLPNGSENGVSLFLRNDVLPFIPHVFVAVFILIIAAIASRGISRFVASGTRAMNVHAANMLGTIAKYAVWIFAFIIALGQLGVAENFMNTLFTGIVFMISLAGALAFGLGGRDAAARFISKVSDEAKN